LWDEGEDTDAQAILAGYVSITPLHLDLTNHAALNMLRREWGGVAHPEPPGIGSL
jgi:5'-nucleotidase